MQSKKLKANKKISIIGGGITGCVSAFLLSHLGYEVNLFEKKERLGGSILDIKENNDIFLNGPQYFQADSDWFKKLKEFKLFKDHFYSFKGSYIHNSKKNNVYKSYIDIFNKIEISQLYAQPSTKIKFKKLKKKRNTSLLKSRLASYQENIKAPIENWCKNFSMQYRNLHESCAEIMSVTRIFFLKDQKKIKLLKKKNKIADKLLGIPMTSDKEMFSVPKKGNDFFFKKFEKILKKRINIHYNSNIKIIKNNFDDLKIFNNQNEIIGDQIIWTANPIPLMKDLGYGVFENPVVRTKVYCANINFVEKYKIDNFYIQVFSKRANIYRIYIYKLNNKLKITIETFMGRDNTKVDVDFLHALLAKFKIKIKIVTSFIEKKEIRHILITQNDYNKFIQFDKDFVSKKLIGGGWHLFGKDRKINSIMKHFVKEV